ncbi:MAG: membrane protein insertion efficiency factor YidD [Spirochaetaceae bacterium]|nr:membrane protein insertion efficiency factor YidD [Spirochaetaceae bacterium]
MIRPIRDLALLSIRFYQRAVSPHLPVSCRYVPSCSAYAYEAIQKYGVFRGSMLGVKRLLRCHPFHPGGYDPVP